MQKKKQQGTLGTVSKALGKFKRALAVSHTVSEKERQFLNDIKDKDLFKECRNKGVRKAIEAEDQHGGNEGAVGDALQECLRVAWNHVEKDLLAATELQQKNAELDRNLKTAQREWLKEKTMLKSCKLDDGDEIDVCFYNPSQYMSKEDQELIALIVKDRLKHLQTGSGMRQYLSEQQQEMQQERDRAVEELERVRVQLELANSGKVKLQEEVDEMQKMRRALEGNLRDQYEGELREREEELTRLRDENESFTDKLESLQAYVFTIQSNLIIC